MPEKIQEKVKTDVNIFSNQPIIIETDENGMETITICNQRSDYYVRYIIN